MKSSQSKSGAALEQGVSIAIGLGIQMGANALVLPFFGFHPTFLDVIGIAVPMTVISIIRGYAVRRLFERARLAKAPPGFAPVMEEIAAERKRQIAGEGFTTAHDDQQRGREIASGAAAYVLAAALTEDEYRDLKRKGADSDPAKKLIAYVWPWNFHHFKPSSPRRDLIKAAAMIIAEIGRRDRAAKNPP